MLVYGVPKKEQKKMKKKQLVDFPVLVDEPTGKQTINQIIKLA